MSVRSTADTFPQSTSLPTTHRDWLHTTRPEPVCMTIDPRPRTFLHCIAPPMLHQSLTRTIRRVTACTIPVLHLLRRNLLRILSLELRLVPLHTIPQEK